MPSTPSTSDDEPIVGVVTDHPVPQVVIGFDGAGGDGVVFSTWMDHGMWLMHQEPERAPSAHYLVDEHGIHQQVKPEDISWGPRT